VTGGFESVWIAVMTVDVVDRLVVRPDQGALGVLISQVSREEVDAAIEVCGVLGEALGSQRLWRT
jgi:hypothetical protein